MKAIVLSIMCFVALNISVFATNYSVTISGTSYVPNLTVVNTGDQITIGASTMHPLVQVSKATWNAGNSATPLSGGWGTQTSDYTFTAGTPDTIYFLCSVHFALGMKGRIVIQGPNQVAELTQLPVVLFHNPATNSFLFTFNKPMKGNLTIRMVNMNGHIISGYNGNYDQTQGNTFEFSYPADLSSGIYILDLIAGNERFSRKVLIAGESRR
ncbi:MAG: T9SS type A sorting domain-containing protein [Bacteroidia bacterium]|nr:T9SS type A sorting domain-containing protein [Bacteroidia bacterium]